MCYSILEWLKDKLPEFHSMRAVSAPEVSFGKIYVSSLLIKHIFDMELRYDARELKASIQHILKVTGKMLILAKRIQKRN